MRSFPNKNLLKLLYAVIFLISASIGTVMVMAPVFAEILVADYMSLGQMGALHAVGYTVMTLVTGYLLNRFEKIRLYIIFNILNAISILVFSYTGIINQVLVLRLILGLTSGTFWVSSSSLTADS